jgi:hypothetical protein
MLDTPTISFDGTARLWDAESENELLAWSGNNNGPNLEFSRMEDIWQLLVAMEW